MRWRCREEALRVGRKKESVVFSYVCNHSYGFSVGGLFERASDWSHRRGGCGEAVRAARIREKDWRVHPAKSEHTPRDVVCAGWFFFSHICWWYSEKCVLFALRGLKPALVVNVVDLKQSRELIWLTWQYSLTGVGPMNPYFITCEMLQNV